MSYTAISLFSGAVDGLAIAAQAAGIKVTHHVEWDAWCCRVLRMNHPDSIVLNEDIHNVHDLPPADIIFGGSPCQDFSVAGSRAGFAGERYLWPEMRRLVEASKPRCVIHENVRGGVSAGLLDRICDDLESLNYECWPLVLPASVFGAPHERYRMVIVGLLAHAELQRRYGTRTQPDTSTHEQQHFETSQSRGYPVTDEVEPSGEAVGNSTIERLEGGSRSQSPFQEPARSSLDLAGRRRSVSQPGMDRAAYGITTRIPRLDPLTDFAGFPAGQGIYQHAYEPPRTTAKKSEYHKERIQALGNAVVWQQVAPIMRSVVRWLAVSS